MPQAGILVKDIEPISKLLQQDYDGGEPHEAEEVERVVVPVHPASKAYSASASCARPLGSVRRSIAPSVTTNRESTRLRAFRSAQELCVRPCLPSLRTARGNHPFPGSSTARTGRGHQRRPPPCRALTYNSPASPAPRCGHQGHRARFRVRSEACSLFSRDAPRGCRIRRLLNVGTEGCAPSRLQQLQSSPSGDDYGH